MSQFLNIFIRVDRIFRLIFKACIWIYKTCVSPFLPSTCRFYPTCSGYAQQSIERYGALKGGYLAIRRILKCHPWYKGDYIDRVPDD